MSDLTRSAIAELVGTFMLVLVGAGAVTLLGQSRTPVGADVVAAALAHGLILVAIISTFDSISGAQVNPAVTLGLLVGGKIGLTKAIVYWIAQLAGGLIAALVLRFIFPNAATLGNTLPGNNINSLQVIVVEALLTFFLTSAVYQVAVYGKGAGIPAPVAIGFTLAGCILFGGPLTGASLNPARTLGPAIVTGNFTEILSYLIGILAGGALAGLLHTTIFKPENIAQKIGGKIKGAG